MNSIKRIILLYCLSIIASSLPVFAGGKGTTSASFLKIDIGARPVGMGGAFCAIADDVNAILYNPAGLVQISRPEVALTHNEWIQGIRSEFAGLAIPIGEYWAIGFAGNYLFITGLEKRDSEGEELGETFEAGGMLGALTLSNRLKDSKISLGVTAKYIQENLDDMTDTSYALDIGMMYELEKLKLGCAVQNLGGKITLYNEGFPLPLIIRLGGSYELTETLKLGLEIRKPDGDVDIRAGGELFVADKFFLRGGYKLNAEENTGSGISLGLGFNSRDRFQVDYGYLPFGDLGNTHRLSMTLWFGRATTTPQKIKKEKPPRRSRRSRRKKKEEPGEYIFCPQCGAKNSATNKFCSKCGAKLIKLIK